MTYPVLITPAAQDNLREAYTFTLLASNEKTAQEKMEAIFEKIFLLEDFPFLGSPYHRDSGREENVRLLVVSSYLIFYSFDEKQISILAVTRQRG
jgi:plasmid stabilization system protein ParE